MWGKEIQALHNTCAFIPVSVLYVFIVAPPSVAVNVQDKKDRMQKLLSAPSYEYSGIVCSLSIIFCLHRIQLSVQTMQVKQLLMCAAFDQAPLL